MSAMAKYTLSYAEINWIVCALNHDLVGYYSDLDHAPNEECAALADLAILNRQRLITKLTDMQADKEAKRVALIH